MQLYSKAHFAVRHAASKDATRFNLNGIHFKADGTTEATDGHILIRVKAETPSGDEYPSVPGVEASNGEALKEFILPTEAAERAVKSIPKGRQTMPVLSNVGLDVKSTNENGAARFITTDLETTAVTEGRKIDGEFPKTDQLIPKVADDAEPTFVIDLNLMERIVKAAKEFGGSGKANISGKPVTFAKFYVSDPLSAILIQVDNPHVGQLEAVIMPCRIK